MSRGYIQTDGTVDRFPDTKDEAKRLRSTIYINKQHNGACAVCCGYAAEPREKYTYNDYCVNCARLNAGDFARLATKLTDVSTVDPDDTDVKWLVEVPYQHRRGQSVTESPAFRPISSATLASFRDGLAVLGILDESDPTRLTATNPAPLSPTEAVKTDAQLYIDYFACKRSGHLGIVTLSGECYFCKKERETPSPRKAAITAGERWYTPLTPCSRCGATSPKRVDNGQCKGCTDNGRPAQSPRQAAVAAGERWYTPLTPCKHCGTVAERRVDNGQCKGCSTAPAAPKRDTVDSQLIRDTPDLVLSRADARMMGFKVFRTGKSCNRNHTGYRYVSTGNCVECLKAR